MPSAYRRGYRFELRVRKYLERRGFKVFRCAASKPVDLIAMSPRAVYLVECKLRRPLGKDLEKLTEYAKGTPATPIVAYRRGRGVVFVNAHTMQTVDLCQTHRPNQPSGIHSTTEDVKGDGGVTR